MQTRITCLLIAVCVAAPVVSSHAAEPLRWKFQPGDTISYVTTQKTDIAVFSEPGDYQMGFEQIMDITWHIDEVTSDGNAKMRQDVERVRLKATLPGLPGGGTVEYDTASNDIPQGISTNQIRILKAMTGSEFNVTMTPRGEVIAAQAPPKLLKELKSLPESAAMGDFTAPDEIRELIMQSCITLPESGPESGKTWQSKAKMKNPLGGVDPDVVTTFDYSGTRDLEGRTLEAIKFGPEVLNVIEPGAQWQMEVEEQKSKGEILFDRDRGHLHSSFLEQEIKVEMKNEKKTFKATINQNIDMKLKVPNSGKK